ncbi:DUF421 domain-containing protein [Spirosoma pollinicola]|uniref:YetF C-terminal domain-containing protein n=1 Tax=Spirosoma pollinicola TaxID=2057025 RepID=A0A2K8Z3Y0_9BACT|nr:YetF domain-containing protein [Spirosoma pollinicola]AUD04544.1 hypothetical protein CWM47_23480 [Spirosoma pollinicola]
MHKEDISLYDWQRILVGEVPGLFYVEILIRAATIYLILVLAMRLMGRRMASRLSRNEMAAMVSLAAAIGVAILDAQRGVLPAFVIAMVVVFTQRVISYFAAKNQKFETISQGRFSTLVQNSVIQLAGMSESTITRELLFAQLRSSGVIHLGHVKRLYMEANGAFTLIEEPNPTPGLSILPEWDTDFVDQQEKADGQLVCYRCGNAQPKSGPKDKCTNCGNNEWVPALK